MPRRSAGVRPLLFIFILVSGAGAVPAGESPSPLNQGLELAREGRWAEAQAKFLFGLQQSPADKRYLIELAGVAYRLGEIAETKRCLHRVLAIDPLDDYANDALGSLYLLEDNLDAALTYWNRIGKPCIRDVTIDFPEGTHAASARRAVEINPGSVLLKADLEITRKNLDRLQIRQYRIQLSEREEGQFRVTITGITPGLASRNAVGFGISLASGLPYQTAALTFRTASPWLTSIRPMIRWDSDKRRVAVEATGLIGRNPRLRYSTFVDGRNEHWLLRNQPGQPAFQMRKFETGFGLESGISSRLDWVNKVSASVRRFRNAPEGSSLFQNGAELKAASELPYRIFQNPERHIDVVLTPGAEVGRLLPAQKGFARISASGNAAWQPGRSGKLLLQHSWTASRTFGDIPFDELYMLGMERDNNLWLRGHLGSYDGKKGNAPMGASYALSQADIVATVWHKPFLSWQLGPFWDSGIASGRYGSHGWLNDTGVQSILRLPASLSLVVVAGHSLQQGGIVCYTAVRYH